MCDYIRCSFFGWLLMFLIMVVDDVYKILVVWFVGSGCVFNFENVYLDCIGCGKIIMFVEGMIILYCCFDMLLVLI